MTPAQWLAEVSLDPWTALFVLLAGAAVLAALRRYYPAATDGLAAELRVLRALVEALDQRGRDQREQAASDALHLREALLERGEALRLELTRELGTQRQAALAQAAEMQDRLAQLMQQHRHDLELRRNADGHALGTSLQAGFRALREELGGSLQQNATALGTRIEALARTTEARLADISGQVERRLSEGFEKTTATFADVVTRLALIDEAQKRITALSGDVVSLQQILADKRSRGAFGEVQLAALVRNVMPEQSFALQHTLPNGRIADCVLFLPAPTGTLAIDAKFPLESYRTMTDPAGQPAARAQAERQFRQDIRRHIHDIASRYILPGVTADGAVMFIPAEAVFAEIQAHHPGLVDEAHAARVWLVSPTTLWAVLTTACGVLRDVARLEQVDVLREHLGMLARDFGRFRERMGQLARHIEQAHEDVRKVNVSADRIAERFERIERAETGVGDATPVDVRAESDGRAD